MALTSLSLIGLYTRRPCYGHYVMAGKDIVGSHCVSYQREPDRVVLTQGLGGSGIQEGIESAPLLTTR